MECTQLGTIARMARTRRSPKVSAMNVQHRLGDHLCAETFQACCIGRLCINYSNVNLEEPRTSTASQTTSHLLAWSQSLPMAVKQQFRGQDSEALPMRTWFFAVLSTRKNSLTVLYSVLTGTTTVNVVATGFRKPFSPPNPRSEVKAVFQDF